MELDSPTATLREGMFVAQGELESRWSLGSPTGSYCLFASPVTGSRQGRTVLVRLRDELDPETGERFYSQAIP